MKNIFVIAIAILSAVSCSNAQNTTNNTGNNMKTLYDFKATDIDGNEFDMAQLKGKKVMIVNVASKCGYTPQYKPLQELYDKYKDKNFVILGFPCNQFMGQEPGDEKEIQSFCERNYGVTFKMFSKIDVKGKEQHPIYQWLTNQSENGVEDSKVSWNFNKYLIDENGHYVKHFESGTDPLSAEIVNWIEGNQ